ncbi:hypothetical protein AS361_05895 [Myroides marinus]|uniref:RNA-directed DNA polymerase n=1 Tax=Myroides marinus TaxID=703342 RepID=UPI0007422D2F|nr:RNA-directed DNA polymerase [Myroides marinus]KUF40207.1 hypothetical protein AS361_05895 [Myroides marinus]
MSLISEILKYCSVKIKSEIAGAPSMGTGIIYQTPNTISYNYILTAKHILSEDSYTPYNFRKIESIEIQYYSKETNEFNKLYYSKNEDFTSDSIIIFEGADLAILKIPKVKGINFPSILVSDDLENEDSDFLSWSIFKANTDSLNLLKFSRNDPSENKIELKSKITKDSLHGLSGSGVFIDKKNILLGIISKYPNENFENAIIECSKITFANINSKLHDLGLIQLDTKGSFLKREVQGRIVELYQAQINNAYLDIKAAIERTRTDMNDDWYYDSLQYIDLLNSDYLFEELNEYFYQNNYKASKAEKFYVPKTNFTLRQAFILPFIDRVIYMAIVGELADVIDDSLIPNVFAHRFNKVDNTNLITNGVEQWLKLKYKISEEINKKENNTYKYNCILHVDILNYYDNIDKKLLIEKLKRVATTNNHLNTIDLLNAFLFNYSSKTVGLPQNNDASALLATFYLNQIDVFINNHTQSYFRFADDIKILCRDKYEARKYLGLLEQELKRCQLAVNSQKTKIVEIVDSITENNTNPLIQQRKDFSNIYNFEIESIKTLSKSSNYQYRNEAFHTALQLLHDNINSDENENEEQARNLNFALRIIEDLGKSKINFHNSEHKNLLLGTLLKAVKVLKDKPWITPQICKILSLIDDNQFIERFSKELTELVLNKNYNLYPYQQFQIWLLFAKQKYICNDLIKWATEKVEINDTTQIATTAAQILYLSTVDKHFKRLLLRKLHEKFTSGYFQNRATLIALRSFNLIEPNTESIHLTLSKSFQFTSKFGHKDLIFYHELEANQDDQDLLEEFFSS